MFYISKLEFIIPFCDKINLIYINNDLINIFFKKIYYIINVAIYAGM